MLSSYGDIFRLIQNTAADYSSTQHNKGMKIFTRTNTDLWPYAASSTGPYRGLLAQKYPCWDAHGPAREAFFTEIADKIKSCLEQCLPESNSFIGYTLFMVGKSPDKTKPYIMVSDDKQRRKAAFKLIRVQKFMAEHPGFELGHCSVAAEFEDLQQLGDGIRDPVSDSDSTSIASQRLTPCATQPLSWTQPTKIGFHTPTGQHKGSGTCGGLFTYNHELYCFTVAHALHQTTMPEPIRHTSGHSSVSSSDSDDCEMTGMDDWDDDGEDGSDTITVASASSQSPFEHSENEDDLVDKQDSSSSFDDDIPRTNCSQMAVSPLVAEDAESMRDTDAEPCKQIGSIIGIERDLDFVIMRIAAGIKKGITMDKADHVQSCEELLKLAEDYKYEMTDTSVVIKTNHYAEIYGRRSKSPVYMRLPGTKTFQLLYNIHFKVPIQAGDCGSWVFNGASGRLVGFVVAGSPRTGWCLVSPARVALEKIITLLEGLPQPKAMMVPRASTERPLMASLLLPAKTPTLRDQTPGFLPVEVSGQLFHDAQGTSDSRTPIEISIQAALDKGFFRSEEEWTCYRRNYFSCVCSYNLTPPGYGLPITYMPNGESTVYQVVGFSISISAVISDSEGQSIGLIQHMPKRDKGPTSNPGKIKLDPKPLAKPRILPELVAGPSVPRDPSRMDSDNGQRPHITEHTFERLQFNRATAKRRASQEYFHLIVELYADVGGHDLKIASRKSEKLIVRGRSPGHY
ncbi:hypothetical protein F4680DRAFT_405339 [Xylaria scruposa]|nr:hypothetical protein F4680DRAFT_405339 [Xylaria scruposa]